MMAVFFFVLSGLYLKFNYDSISEQKVENLKMSGWQFFLVVGVVAIAGYFVYEAWLWVYSQHWALYANQINGSAVRGWYADGWWVLKFAWPFFSVGLIIGGGIGFVVGHATELVMVWIDNKTTAKKKQQQEQEAQQYRSQQYATQASAIAANRQKLESEINAVKQQEAALIVYEKKLQAEKESLQQTLQGMEKKLKAMQVEREDARNRAKRVGEELKTLRRALKEN